MFQYYLRAEGLALSWIGSGRLIFSLNYTQADFDAVADRFVAAAKRCSRTAGGGLILRHRTRRSGVRFCAKFCRIGSRGAALTAVGRA